MVVCVGVQSLVDDDVVLEEGFEVFPAPWREKEAIDLWSELLESRVWRGEESSTGMFVGDLRS